MRSRVTPQNIITAICIAVIAIGGAILAADSRTDARITAENEELRALKNSAVQIVSTPDISPTPLPTPDGDTIRITLPTEPPRDDAYAMLSAINADYCGWLQAGDIDLPVVHRENDNVTYLTTSFSGEESPGGTLFIDGFNRLYPADTLTIIYGHNMKSGDMFGALSQYKDAAYLRANPIVRFDTIYGPAQYVPFALFAAGTEDVDIRQFQPTVEEFNALVDQCTRLSLHACPVDVRYGDQLLALVTCQGDDDRFFVLCRRLRDGETAEGFIEKFAG